MSGKKSMYNIINDLYIRIIKNHTSKQSKKDKSKNQKSILSLGFVQVQNSLPSINNSNISEKKDELIDNNSKEENNKVDDKLSKPKRKSKTKSKTKKKEEEPVIGSNVHNKSNEIIDISDDKDKPTSAETKKQDVFIANSSSSTSSINPPTYNQQFFDYKSFKAPSKRKSSPSSDPLLVKKSKKHPNNWIKKESNKPDKQQILPPPQNSVSSGENHKSGFSSCDDIDINKTNKLVTIKEEVKESEEKNVENVDKPILSSQSSFNSLEFNSRIQSKEKFNNFKDEVPKEHLKPPSSNYGVFLRSKNPETTARIKQRDMLIEGINAAMNNLNTKKDYALDLQTIDDTVTYDEFYKLKNGNRNKTKGPLGRKSLPMMGIGRNVKVKYDLGIEGRNKKDREKMDGHKCELCQKFYDTMGENGDKICDECSRHRTNEKPNSTPKGFYDLSI